jgi:thymidylate synthase (FAD)
MLSSDLRDAVRLVSVTNPSELVRFTNKGKTKKVSPEELIVYIARVSNPSNQMNMETAPKLINYLIKHKHWSPFEFVDMTVDIVTRRSIAAQILRHKSFSFQEFSQRYSTATEIQPIELRKQGKTNRQSSEDLIQDAELESDIQQHISNSKLLYDKLISNGVSRETARDVLPLATETTMYMKGSVRSWIHYLELRCSSDTQKEHREIAEGIKTIFINKFPNISEALGWKHGS